MPTSTSRNSVLLALLIIAAFAQLQQATANAGPAADAAHFGKGHGRDRTSCRRMKETTHSALKKIIWPTSMQIALSGVPPPEFSTKVNGRIVPVGTFQTNFGALEYFYRLAGPLDPNDNTTNRVVSYDVRWMVCEPGKRQVAFESIFRFVMPTLLAAGLPGASYNISAMGIFVFDKDGRICSYDWDLRRLGLVVQYQQAPFVEAIGEALYNEALIKGICQAHFTFCTGADEQYKNEAECLAFLTKLPVGNFDVADQNNMICRSLHAMLVPLRPAVHCSHIGPTGGGKCVEHPPNTLFTDDFSTCAA